MHMCENNKIIERLNAGHGHGGGGGGHGGGHGHDEQPQVIKIVKVSGKLSRCSDDQICEIVERRL